MASTWKQSITTSTGIALMNKAYGVSSIIPTKAVTITDNISGYSVTQLMALTSVKYNQSRVPIVVSNQANTTRIGIDIDNKDVNEQYDYYGIGVYFKQVNTGEEVLFSVIPLTGAATIIPNQSGVATSSISIDSYTSIVPGTKVDLAVSDSGSVTRSDVEQIVAANQSYSFPKKPAASGIDFYTLKSVGIYQIKDDKTVVNAPGGFSGNGYIIVIGDGTTANPITQDLFDTVTGNKYSNSYDSDGNKWTGWEEMASKSDVTTAVNAATANKADDSKVAHLSGANNFDTVPTVNNNPLLLASSLPSDLARTGSNQEFTGNNTFDTAPIDKTTGHPYITKDGVPSNYATQQQLATKADTSAIDPSVMVKRTLTANDDVFALGAGTYWVWGTIPKNYPSGIQPASTVVVRDLSNLQANGRSVTITGVDGSQLINTYAGNPIVWFGWIVPNSGTMASKHDVTTAVNSATAKMANPNMPTNFTAGLQSGGVYVATAADLKSVEDRAWRKLDNKYIIPDSGYTLSPKTTILYKIDDSNHKLYLAGFVALNENPLNIPVTIQLGSIVNSILNSNVEYIGYYYQSNDYGLALASQSSTNLIFSVAWGYASIVAGMADNEGSFVTYTELI